MNEKEIVLDFYKNDPEGAKKALARMNAGEHGAYIIGEWYFWRHTFKVNRDCLIPRPDTECIVEKAISEIPKNAVFADLCTGSGCIVLSILSERSDLTAVAVDISDGALRAAKENASMLGLSDRVKFIKADLLKEDPLGNNIFGTIVSNPPYIKASVVDASADLSCEPRIALAGGEDGLVFYRHFVKNFKKNLSPNGKFIFEIGFDQREQITNIAEKNGLVCNVTKDYGSNDRVAVIEEI